jgi:hypothetical protein
MKQTFPGYYRPSAAEFEKLWKEATFTFDANVLLRAYGVGSQKEWTPGFSKLCPPGSRGG